MPYKLFWLLRAIIYSLAFRKVGRLTYLGSPIFVHGWRRISIGKNCRIFPGLRIESHGDHSSITIHDNVSIAQNVQITSASNLEIGSNTIILGSVFVTDIHHEYTNISLTMRDQPIQVRKSRIGENCFIGFGASVQAGTQLGNHCVVGAGAVIQGTFPDYSVIAGVPGKVVKRLNQSNRTWEKMIISEDK